MPEAMVSVVLANYNDAGTVGEALEAWLGQTYRALEVIVVDDGSTDHSLSVIGPIAERDTRVRVIPLRTNIGLIGAQRVGLAEAVGVYVFLASANDAPRAGCLAALAAALGRHPGAAVAVCDFHHIGDAWQNEPVTSPDSVYLTPEALVEALKQQVFLIGGASLIRRAALTGAGEVIADLRWMADYFAAHVAAFRHGLCRVRQPLYDVRPPVYSITGPRSAAQKLATRSLLDLIGSDDYADVRPAFLRSGILASVHGLPAIVARYPAYWSVLSWPLVRRALLEGSKNIVRPWTPAGVKHAYRRARNSLGAANPHGPLAGPR
jgi:glycosyltransferase involved in cell wall biosynthesis